MTRKRVRNSTQAVSFPVLTWAWPCASRHTRGAACCATTLPGHQRCRTASFRPTATRHGLPVGPAYRLASP